MRLLNDSFNLNIPSSIGPRPSSISIYCFVFVSLTMFCGNKNTENFFGAKILR